jgi:CelD/BcsL family acetyltransferase involved in cellulose biosynthesis
MKDVISNRDVIAPHAAMYDKSPLKREFLCEGVQNSATSVSGHHVLRVKIYNSLDDLSTLVPEWEQLLSHCPDTSIFSTWQWLGSWWRAFGDGQKLCVLAFEDSSSRLVALAPLSLTFSRFFSARSEFVRLLSDGSGDADNLDLPVRPGYEEHFARALLEFLETQGISWHHCEFNTMPANSPVASALQKELRRRHWPYFGSSRPCTAVYLPDTWDTYLQQLSGEDQKNLNRYARRLRNRYRTRIYRCQEESDLPICLEALFRLHQARWHNVGELGSFGSNARRQFYYELSRALLALDRLELWVLELDGSIAAVQYAFRYGATVFQLQEGYDPTRSSDRVGFVLRGHVIKDLIGRRIRKYDFLGGEPGYKVRWLARRGNYLDLHFARPFTKGSLYLRLVHEGGEIKEWLRARLPRSSWNLLHRINTRLHGRQYRETCAS